MGVVTGMNAPGLAGSTFRSPTWIALVSIFMFLLPFPTRSFFSVFKNNAGFQQLSANLIGPRKVAILFRLRSLANQRFHGCVGHTGLAASWTKHVKDGVEAIEYFDRPCGISRSEFARIHGGVGVTHV